MSTPRKHGEPRGSAPRQELLYDPNIATPSHAERARTLVASATRGVLCTHAAELDGHPYGSLVIFALHEGAPVFLISELAEHTRNLHGSPRCSLLVTEAGGTTFVNASVCDLGYKPVQEPVVIEI